jgi:hypothetical protein
VKAKPKYKLHVTRFLLQSAFAFILLCVSVKSFSQAESPYSVYGLGALRNPVFSANQGMGYLAAPYASGVNINYANPASYASLTRTTIDLGVIIDGNRLNAGNDSNYRSSNASVDHFAIALVPNSKNNAWAICLGLLPYSTVNYNYIENFNDNSIGPYSESFIGSGSLYNAYVGGAYKVKGFSIGANVGFIFGQLEYQKVLSFPQDSFQSYSTQNITQVNIKSFSYNIGVQYQKLIYHNRDDPDARRDIYAFFGAYGATSLKMTAKVTSYWDREIFNTASSSQTVIDTLAYQPLQIGKITLPYNWGAGVMFGNERFWLWGADFKYNGWGSFNTILDNGGLVNSWQVSTGAQVTPKYDDRNYLLRMQYRVGAYYGKSEISFAGSQLTQAGATIGLGFPFKSVAHLNLTGDFGQLGAAGNPQVLQQTYYRFTLIKRRFD